MDAMEHRQTGDKEDRAGGDVEAEHRARRRRRLGAITMRRHSVNNVCMPALPMRSHAHEWM
eukprot:4430595-Amphidinium_carterae.1